MSFISDSLGRQTKLLP